MATIIALDTYPINPGDQDWSPITQLGECTLYERTSAGEIYERAKSAEFILTNKVPLTQSMIDRLPRLKYIGVMATGYNIVDTDAAHARGITVTNVPSYSTESVAQLVFALILELTHHAGAHSRSVHEGKWTTCRDFTYRETPLVELAGLTLGIFGYGTIGRAVARIGLAFGMRVLATSRRKFDSTEAVVYVDEETLFRESDVLTLHCPLTNETRGLVNDTRLEWMKPGAFLINTSRGPVIDEAAVARALNSGRIAGAGIDVLSSEPPDEANPLLSAANCIITPHIAWATFAARRRLIDVIAQNIRAFISGAPQNTV
ncbi:MAG TPA: D-2-hydroxyacid dehydrogenase [Bacteroidota bacterium]|nr:D-2-hydroxyacid dehydrogenase [Bacteroidota bacterium]